MTIVARTTKKELTKQHRANFILTWSSTLIKEIGDIFHHNFKDGMRVHPIKYKGVNLSETTNT
jgi:hypothetical protein